MQQITSPSPKFSLEEFDLSCPKSKRQNGLDWTFRYGVHEVEGHWTKISGEKFIKEKSLIFENNSMGILIWLWILLTSLLVFTFPFLLPFFPIFLGISLSHTRKPGCSRSLTEPAPVTAPVRQALCADWQHLTLLLTLEETLVLVILL